MIAKRLRANSLKLPRVILADDHTLLLEALRKLVEPRCEVVATVADGRALLKAAVLLEPDVVIADISMPLLNGLEAGRQLRKMAPAVKLIFLTMNEDPDLAAEALRAGASGYLLKKSAASELFQAIQETLHGGTYVTPQIAQAMQKAFVRNPKPRKRRELLTPRQREVMQLLAEGRSMKEAAQILHVTPRTVAFHKYRIMSELKLKTNSELFQYAMKTHILTG